MKFLIFIILEGSLLFLFIKGAQFLDKASLPQWLSTIIAIFAFFILVQVHNGINNKFNFGPDSELTPNIKYPFHKRPPFKKYFTDLIKTQLPKWEALPTPAEHEVNYPDDVFAVHPNKKILIRLGSRKNVEVFCKIYKENNLSKVLTMPGKNLISPQNCTKQSAWEKKLQPLLAESLKTI